MIGCLGFNDTSTHVGHFASSPREREKRDRRNSRGDEREGQGRKREMKESEGTEEITTFPIYPFLLQGQRALLNCKPISVGRPGDKSYRTPSPHPTTPKKYYSKASDTLPQSVSYRTHIPCSTTTPPYKVLLHLTFG